MFTTATATMPLTRPGPRAAMMATARRKYGKASSVSMERMMSWSTQRPMKPARSPHSEPTRAARAVAVSPTTREMRAPKRRRLRRSRPNSSVPSGCPAVRMGARRRAVSMTSGSRGAIHGASTASTAMTATSPRPKRAALLLRNMRTRSVIADARIEDRVEKIDHEVDEHEGRGDEEHAALDERVVAGLDGAHHHGAEPRPREDRLRQDGPAQEKAHLQPQHRDDGVDRVLEHVARDHGALGQALGARRADIVLRDHLVRAGAREAREGGGGGGAERHRGQHEMPQHVGHSAAIGRAHPARGEPAELEREQQDEHDPRPEDGQAHAGDGHPHADAIEPRVLLDRRHDAGGETQKNGDQKRARREHQGGLEAQEHLGEDGPAQRDGAAEISLEDGAHPPHVLDDARLVEAQVAMEAHDVFLGRLGAEHDGGGIPRRQVQDGEDQHRDPEQHGDGEEQAAEGVGGKPAAPYCSHTCVSTRSKFGWSLKPCTRFRWMMICRPWSMKIHGASSLMMRWASL